MRKTKLLSSVLSVAVIFAFAAGAAAETAGSFPGADRYVIKSRPAFEISVGDQTELVKTEGTMVVTAGEPYQDENGERRVDLEILEWDNLGYSELLGGELRFRLSTAVQARPASFAIASRAPGTDFPADVTFAIPYDVDTPFGTVTGANVVIKGQVESFPLQAESVFVMDSADIVNVMKELMPEPLSELSAAGDVAPLSATIEPVACECEEQAGAL